MILLLQQELAIIENNPCYHLERLEECSLFNSNYEFESLKSWVEDEYALLNTEYESAQDMSSFGGFIKEQLTIE